jgi:hypothetical protein
LIGGRESFENGHWFLTNVAVIACQALATLAPKYSNPVANTKALPAVATSDFDAQI